MRLNPSGLGRVVVCLFLCRQCQRHPWQLLAAVVMGVSLYMVIAVHFCALCQKAGRFGGGG
jgi:hypothetical protein